MRDILEMKKYQLELVDIALDSSARDRMREIAANKTALPPQLANGDVYCGGYDEFDLAVEDEILDQFLKVNDTTTVETAPPCTNDTIESTAS